MDGQNLEKKTDRLILAKDDTENLITVHQFLEVICRAYTSVYYVDLKNDVVEPIKVALSGNVVKMVRIRVQADLAKIMAGEKDIHDMDYRWMKGKPFVMIGRVSDKSLRYLYHPLCGEVMVRCSGRRIEDSDDMITLEGYHRIISDIEER